MCWSLLDVAWLTLAGCVFLHSWQMRLASLLLDVALSPSGTARDPLLPSSGVLVCSIKSDGEQPNNNPYWMRLASLFLDALSLGGEEVVHILVRFIQHVFHHGGARHVVRHLGEKRRAIRHVDKPYKKIVYPVIQIFFKDNLSISLECKDI